MLIDARLTGWFGTSLYALSWVSSSITKLSLSVASYFITSSAKVDRLWSSIFCDFHLFNCIYSRIRKKHLWAFPQLACINCLNMWCIPTSSASGRGCRFVFHAPFNSIYISQFFPILPILFSIQRESLLFGELCFRRLFTLFIHLLRPSLLPETVCLVSLLFFSPIYHFLRFS